MIFTPAYLYIYGIEEHNPVFDGQQNLMDVSMACRLSKSVDASIDVFIMMGFGDKSYCTWRFLAENASLPCGEPE